MRQGAGRDAVMRLGRDAVGQVRHPQVLEETFCDIDLIFAFIVVLGQTMQQMQQMPDATDSTDATDATDARCNRCQAARMPHAPRTASRPCLLSLTRAVPLVAPFPSSPVIQTWTSRSGRRLAFGACMMPHPPSPAVGSLV